MRGEAFDGEGAGDPQAFVVFVGLVVEQFAVGPAGDGCVDFGLAFAAHVPVFLDGPGMGGSGGDFDAELSRPGTAPRSDG